MSGGYCTSGDIMRARFGPRLNFKEAVRVFFKCMLKGHQWNDNGDVPGIGIRTGGIFMGGELTELRCRTCKKRKIIERTAANHLRAANLL